MLERRFPEIPFQDETSLFLTAVWKPYPDDAILGLTYDLFYQSKGEQKKGERPLWAIKAQLPEFLAEHLPALARRNAAKGETGNVYFRPAARKRAILDARYRTGTIDELTSVASIWCDIDCAARGIDYKRAFEVLCDMQATAIWFTGGGLQAIWITDGLIDVSTAALAREFKARALAFLLPQFKEAGIEVDTSVHDATRMLRLVGFQNKKPSRNGAVATLLHFEPDRLLPLKEFQSVALPAKQTAKIPHEDGVFGDDEYVTFVNTSVNDRKQGNLFYVSGEFVARLIRREPPVERHPSLVKIAASAASAGIPKGALLKFLRPLALEWFSKTGESRRAYDELDSIVNWAYQNAEPSGLADRYAVRLTDSGFELIGDAVKRYRKPVALAEQPPDTIVATEADQDSGVEQLIPLTDIRSELPSVIGSFLDAPRRRGEIGKTLVIKAPLGSGKTHSVWNALHKRALADDKFKAVFYGLFKYSKTEWAAYLKEFGLTPDDVMYFEARNGRKGSAGYCAYHEEATTVANKGYRVYETLCIRCPHLEECRAKWYLAQKEVAAKSQLIYARHNHAAMLHELSEGRNAVVIDESVVDLLEAPISLTLEDFADANNKFLEVNDPDAYAACCALLRAFRAVLASTPTKGGKFIDFEKHVRDGKWIIDQLLNYIEGEDAAAKKQTLDLALSQSDDFFDALHPIINSHNNQAIIDVDNLPRRFLAVFMRVFRAEYKLWSEGKQAWNSRLYAFNNRFQVYPLIKVGVDRPSKAIIIDGTADPSLYETYIQTKDRAKFERREVSIYDPQAPQIAKVIQYSDASFSKSSVISNLERFEGRENESGLIAMIPDALRYGLKGRADSITSKVLIVCYKQIKAKIRKLVTSDPLLSELSKHGAIAVEHFGNLRGRNDYAEFDCVMIVGTPRIPESELIMRARARHHEDDVQIGSQKVSRVRPYKGTPLGNVLFSYSDERLDRIAYKMIDDEIRQCAERIRPNVPDLKGRGKLIILLTNFPTSYKVNELELLSDVQLENAILAILPLLPKSPYEYTVEELIDELMKRGLKNRDAIRRALQRLGLTGRRGYRTKNRLHRELAKSVIKEAVLAELSIGVAGGLKAALRSEFFWLHYCSKMIENFSLTPRTIAAILKEIEHEINRQEINRELLYAHFA